MWNEALDRCTSLPPENTLEKLRILLPGLCFSRVISRHLALDARPGGDDFDGHPFDLDGKRSAEEILAQGCGGSCGSYGKVLAYALIKTGTAASSVHLVDTVGENQRLSAFRAEQNASASGHMFLLVKNGSNQWHLANTTSPTLEDIEFLSPHELQRRMNDPVRYAIDPVHLKAASREKNNDVCFPSLVKGPPQDIYRDLVVFGVHQSNLYPAHDISQRIRDVARVVPSENKS